MTVSFAARRCPAPVPTPCCPPCRRLAGAYRGSRTRWRNTHRWQPAWRQVRTCLTRRARSLRFLPPLPSIRVVVRCRPKRTAWSFLQKIFGCGGRGRRRRTTLPCHRGGQHARACRRFASRNASPCRRSGNGCSVLFRAAPY